MNQLYGVNLKYLPNRMRITTKYKYDKNSIHIEGIDIFDNDNGNVKLKWRNSNEKICILGC